MKDIDKLLTDCPSPKQNVNIVEANKPLADAIVAFLDLKAMTDERVAHLSLSWFYIHKLRDEYSGPKCFGTVRNYVREFLKRDHLTGLSL